MTTNQPTSARDGAVASDKGPLVSVVVPTRNSIRTIETCLRSIRGQTYRHVELIVVDNFSDDGTWEVASALADVALQAGPERSAQRNLGIRRATGELVLWIDSDMELPADILQHSVDALFAADAVGLFAPEITVGQGFWTACRALERSCCTDELLVQAPRLVRRDYLLEGGGFLESLSGTEDAELRTRMIADGARLVSIPDLIIHHEGRLTFWGTLQKRYYYGRGLHTYGEQHPGALSGQAGAAVRAYARNWRRLAAHPATAAGVGLLRIGELVAYAVGAATGRTRGRGR
jgi:glycosyltransferase involved in cell wall biosynthesis